jgi:hypothetical protein
MSLSRFKIWVGTFGIDVFIAFLFFGLWVSLSGFPRPYILVLMVGYNILDTHTHTLFLILIDNINTFF